MKTALITGANKGIGLETVKQLSKLGYQVFLGSRNELKGLEAIDELKKFGITNVKMVELDVTNSESIKSAFNTISLSISTLDLLINNAGILGEMPQQASNNSIENLKNIYETNFFGAIQTTQVFLELLKKSENPRIVNVSSDLGSLTQNSNPDYPFYEVKLLGYNSSKTALNAFTVALAYELKDTNFKINSVNPGYTATDLNGFTGTQPVEKAAEIIVKYATIDGNGPSGQFISDYGITPW